MSFPKYPKYKDSGVEWLGQVPAHWDVTPVKFIASIVNGYPFDSALFDPSEGAPLIRIRDLNKSEAETYYKGDFVEDAAITSEDVLIGMDGDFNVGRWRGNKRALLNQRMCCVRGKNSLITRLLEYALPIPLKLINEVTYATTVKHLASSQVEKTLVALPPNPTEQAELANFLDRETAKIDALVAEQRRLMELLKEKRQAVISHAVTKGLNPHAPMKPSGIEWLGDVPAHWSISPLMWLTDLDRPIMYGIVLPGPDVGEGVPILKGGNVKPSRMNLASMARTTLEIEAPYARARLRAGDLVYAIRGTIGDCEEVPRELEGANITQDVARISIGPDVCHRWLRWTLLAPPVREDLACGSLGAAVRGVNICDLKKVRIPVPPLRDQRAISQFLDTEIERFESLIAEAQRAIDLLQERRTALISAAVTGQIDVRPVIADSLPFRKPYTSWFARQLLAAEILQSCHAHPTTGRVKLQKLIHLCEHVAEVEEVHGSYARKAAGPFDHKVMFGIASGLRRLEWFAEEKGKGRTLYRPLAKAGDHGKYLARWKDKLPKIRHVLNLLGTADTQQCEIVSTLYAAWNDLIIEGKPVTDAEIIQEASSPDRWHENKALILAEKWPKALNWMRKHGLVPTGFGSHTKSSKQSAEENEEHLGEKDVDEPA